MLGCWGVRLAWRAVCRIRLDEVVWKYSQKEKNCPFIWYFAFTFNTSIIKRKSICRRWRAGYISKRRTIQISDFLGFFDYLLAKEDGVQFRVLQLHSHWFGIIYSQLFGTSLSWISCAYFQFVLRNTGKMSRDKVLKAIWASN